VLPHIMFMEIKHFIEYQKLGKFMKTLDRNVYHTHGSSSGDSSERSHEACSSWPQENMKTGPLVV
jgi:hypothetical protein